MLGLLQRMLELDRMTREGRKEAEGKLGREKIRLAALLTPETKSVNYSSVFFKASSYHPAHLLPCLFLSPLPPSLSLPLSLFLSPRSLTPTPSPSLTQIQLCVHAHTTGNRFFPSLAVSPSARSTATQRGGGGQGTHPFPPGQRAGVDFACLFIFSFEAVDHS